MELCNEFIGWDEEISQKEFKNLTNDDTLLKFAVGFSQKQFWYQETPRIMEEFNRQVELLEILPSEISSTLDLEKDCAEATGFNLRSFRTLLFAIFALGNQKSDLTSVTIDGTLSRIHPDLTIENINKVMDRYSADYKEIRDSDLKENFFFLKPIVRTSAGRLVNVNQFLLAKKVTDGPFWAIRDLYFRKGSASFVNEYGRLFEHYVEKLLSFYLRPDQFERIPHRDGVKLADWILVTDRFRIIVEQKTAIATIAIKRLYPDATSIRNYLKRFEEGIIQLDSTERDTNERLLQNQRVTIKLLLHYETFYISDGTLRPIVLKSVSEKVSTTDRIFFLDIGEFEWFVEILGTNMTQAEAILDMKLALEKERPGVGLDFNQVISRISKTSKKYIFEEINHWKRYIAIDGHL